MSVKSDLTFKDGKKIVGVQSNQDYWNQFKGLTWSQFNEKIGMPINTKTSLPTRIYKYEDDLINDIIIHHKVWVKKATGLGITEIINRFIAWMCTKDDHFKNNQIDVSVVIITGTRTRLSIQIIERIKNLFADYFFEERESIAYVNGCKIEAFPSSSTQTARGLSPFIVFLDEADFFEPNEQEEARTTAERYIIKTNPFIIFVSTPNIPGGLFETMEKEEPSMYKKIPLLYDVGLRDGMFNLEEIEKGKLSMSFEREYNGKYGVGIGNIFPNELVNLCSTSYELGLKDGDKVLAVDPAYGSSMFAIIGLEKIDGIIYVKEAMEIERASPSAMTDLVELKSRTYHRVLVDSAHPGLIRDLKDRGIDAVDIQFNKELSNMTQESAQAVKELRVRIHPIYVSLISQLKSVKYNNKGHPDKKQLTFDLGDAFMMGCNYFKSGSGYSVTLHDSPYVPEIDEADYIGA